MKQPHKLWLGLLLLISWGCSETLSIQQLKKFAATENYPNDIFLDTVQNKKALVIVAHDDDDCAMSGTIAKLTAKGWAIKQLSLQNHLIGKTGKNPAHIICQGNELLLKDRYYRLGLDTMKMPYMPIPYEEIKKQFLTDKVAKAILEQENNFAPSVIFTLDNEKGGYGHPEHVFISQLVKDLFENKQLKARKIYQSVYTNHMEAEIVDKWLNAKMEKWRYPSPSKAANELYHIDGMPEPTVQVKITEVSETKMKYLRGYEEEVRQNVRKFVPEYEKYDAKTYFGVFDREFFRVIE